MNERILIKLFALTLTVALLALFFGTRVSQSLADRSVEAVLNKFQTGHGKIISELVRNDVLNGNNRAVIDTLERMRASKIIDEYRYNSFVSDFEYKTIDFSSTEHFKNEISINFSDTDNAAAKILLIIYKDNFVEPKNQILAALRIGYVTIFFLIIGFFFAVLFLIRSENRRLNSFIDHFLTDNKAVPDSIPSQLWMPIVATITDSKQKLDDLNAQLSKAKVTEAIARTTQMLAHDVRKPFALFRMTLDRVKSAGSSDQVQQALQEALPEVERSLANVNGLISDVLNVGGEFNLVLKPVWLAPVVEDVVDELRKLHPTRTLNVQISIPPDLWVEADDTRLPRVFLNILSNAIEAVETKEVELWISASGGEQNSHSKGGHVEIRVGNLGSFIAPEARSKLFDLFYTSGKKGGTGLGLAIVRKIIEAHGSTVVCSSERSEACAQGKVEFGWKLARAASNTLSSPVVSAVSSENAAVSSENSGHMPISPVNSAPSPLAEDPAPAALPNVVFLDDSPLARWVWEAKLKAKAKVISFASPGDFWKALENSALELGSLHTIITDHYFAPEEKVTGIEFAAQLRQQGFVGRILLASNGEFDAERLSGIVDKIVDKQPVDWELLSS